MFVITLEVEPIQGTKQAKDYGGAHAVCWINFSLQDGAEHLAKFYLEQDGWKTIEIQDVGLVDEELYDKEFEGEERDRLKQYFAEAETDGACIVTYTWPLGADVDDTES